MVNKVQVSDVVLVRGGRVLLVQQLKPSAFGKWGLPGGKAEPGETPEQAVLREIQEELGVTLDASFAEDAITHQSTVPDEAYMQVTTYLAKAPDAPLRLKDDELMGLGWFTLDELRCIAPALRSSWILEMAEKALEECK